MAELVFPSFTLFAHHTESYFQDRDRVLKNGEIWFSSDRNGAYKVGDGLRKWSELPYAEPMTADAALSADSARAVQNQAVTRALKEKAPASHTHAKSQITDFPVALKNPAALTVSLNGTSQGAYDGSAAKSFNITAAAVGAAAASHSHSYLSLSGGTLSGALSFGNTPSIVWNHDSSKLELTADSSSPLLLRRQADGSSAWTTLASVSAAGEVKAASFNGNAASATKASQDSTGQPIHSTYLKGLSVSGRTITYTKGDGKTGTLTTQDTTYAAATASAAGLMSAADKAKLNGVASGANAYTLPTASSATLGGVKTTSTVTSASGYTPCPIVEGVPYYKDTNTTYSLGSFGLSATAAELNYCKGVTSSVQTQLNAKAAASHTHAKSQITDFPAALKSPAALTVSLNGTSQGAYDGSAAKTFNITAASVGAAAASHTHSYAGSASAGGAATTALACSGNAATAAKLQTARTINGTSFNGSANITTASWGTARTITIGSTGKSVNGGGNVAWSLAEIGAAASSHSHSYLPLSGGSVSGSISASGTVKASNLKFDQLYSGSTQSAISFTAANYDFLIINGTPGSSSNMVSIVIPGAKGIDKNYQFADDENFYSFKLSSTGIGAKISGVGGYIKQVYGGKIV